MSHTTQVPDLEFLDLLDTPSSFSGESLKLVRVNAGETALELVTGSSVYLPLEGGIVTGQLLIDGGANEIQLRIQGHTSQSARLQTWETSAASVVARVDVSGTIGAAKYAHYGDNNIYVDWGSGTPESAVQGSPGAIFGDWTNGEAYVKNTGSASTTGWDRLYRVDEDLFVSNAGDTITGTLIIDLTNDVTGLTIQGSFSQSDYLQSWQNSAASDLAVVTSAGIMRAEYFSSMTDLDALLDWGAGTPESSVYAGPGSIYGDTTNGVMYVKETGVDTTGWIELLKTSGGVMADNAGIIFGADSDYTVGYNSTSDRLTIGDGGTLGTPIIDIAANSVRVNQLMRFPDNIPIRFGTGSDISIGYVSADDEFVIAHGVGLTSEIALRVDASENVTIDNVLSVDFVKGKTETTLTDATATAFATATLPSAPSADGGKVFLTVTCDNGTDAEVFVADYDWVATFKSITPVTTLTLVSSTIKKSHSNSDPTLIFTTTQASAVVTFKVNFDTSIGGTPVIKMRWNIFSANSTVARV